MGVCSTRESVELVVGIGFTRNSCDSTPCCDSSIRETIAVVVGVGRSGSIGVGLGREVTTLVVGVGGCGGI